MAKADLIAEAESLDLELKALIADNQLDDEDAEGGEEEGSEDEGSEDEGTEEDEEEEEAEEDDGAEIDATGDVPAGPGVHVFKPSGAYVRTYSKEIHGAKYADLAKQFVSSNPERGYVTKGK